MVYIEVGERFNSTLYVVGIDGKQKIKISEGGGNPDDLAYVASWSSDGKQLAFQALNNDPNLKSGLYTVALDDSGKMIEPPRLITNKNVSAFTWSPGGRQIAYKVDADKYELYVASSDGKTPGQLVAAVGQVDSRYSSLGRGLLWSPDSRYLAMSGASSVSYGAMWNLWLVTPQEGRIEEYAGYYINRLIGFTADSTRLIATMASSGQSNSIQAYIMGGNSAAGRNWRSYDRGYGPLISNDSFAMAYYNKATDSKAEGQYTGDNLNRLTMLNFSNGATRSVALEYTPYYAFKARFFAWEPGGKNLAFYENNTIYLANAQGQQQKPEILTRAFAVDKLAWTRGVK